jgi:hypothetical protein
VLELLSKMDKSHLNYSSMTHNMGLVWCTIFGLSRGGLYASTKVSEDLTAIGTTQILLFTSLMIWGGGYIFGKMNDVNFGYDAF